MTPNNSPWWVCPECGTSMPAVSVEPFAYLNCPACDTRMVRHSPHPWIAHARKLGEELKAVVEHRSQVALELTEAKAQHDGLHTSYRYIYALWCRVARAMTPEGGPDITDEEVADKAEALKAQLAEAREVLRIVLAAWTWEANQGDGIQEGHAEDYERARAFLAKNEESRNG